jgi:hypothetical protein
MFSHVYTFHHPWRDDANNKLFGPHVLLGILFFKCSLFKVKGPVSLSIQNSELRRFVYSNLYDLYTKCCKSEHYAVYICVNCCSWRVYFVRQMLG